MTGCSRFTVYNTRRQGNAKDKFWDGGLWGDVAGWIDWTWWSDCDSLSLHWKQLFCSLKGTRFRVFRETKTGTKNFLIL